MGISSEGPKLRQFSNFLTNSDSEESKNYIDDIIAGGTKRPEDLFVQKFLSVDLWKELGFSDTEIKIQYPAGPEGHVEITLLIEGQKIAIECKRPYIVKNGRAIKLELDGDDILELKNQIERYLLSHSYVVFTNGFHWYFYSRESYSIWLTKKNEKDNELRPYFEHLTSGEIFLEESPNYILNFIHRQNILESLSGMGSKSIRHFLTDEFFVDLKSWVGFIDQALREAPADIKARTTSLINKLIFVRTMEGVGIIPNGFLATLWDNKKGVRNSTVDFIDHIDDELNEIYYTELFTPKYIEDEEGNPVLKDNLPQYSKERQRNFAYIAIPEEFFSAILRPTESLSVSDLGRKRVSFQGKEYYLRSLYWWRFESILTDILGKAYETYLARQRKKLGIYYTPHLITNYLTSKTVNNVFDNKLSRLKSELAKEIWDIQKIKSIANEIRDIKICDPSCGSGSFLIQSMRIIWKKYGELEQIVKQIDKKFVEGRSVLDDYFTEKVAVLKYLSVLFRINDKQTRMGTLILRHIFGNDKDVKAIDTAKLNIWLECLRLDPNSFRKEVLKGKRYVLPNLELNLTIGDSLIGLDLETTDKTLTSLKDSLKSIFGLREKYVEGFDNPSIAKSAVYIRSQLQVAVDRAFMDKFGAIFAQDLMNVVRPTHWAIHHWDAFYDKNGELKKEDQRGFDIVVGNPPWEILKPNINEFFGPLHDVDDPVKFTKMTKIEKNKQVEKQLKNPNIVHLYKTYLNEIDLQRKYYAKTKSYRYQSAKTTAPKQHIDVNCYKLFTEKYHSLLKKGGISGIVLPSNVYTDIGAKGLRQLIFDKSEILSLYSFENRKGIFEEIHRQLKFIMLVFRKGSKTSEFKSAFYIRDVDRISTLDDKALLYDISLVKKASPDSLTLLECKNQIEVNIIKKILKFPLLSEVSDWKIRFQREFHMTYDSHLFNTERNGSILYEGKMIHQYTYKYGEPRYWIETKKGRKALEIAQLKRLKKEVSKMGKKKQENISLPEIKIDFDYYRLAWRDVTNATNQRTLISTILPPGAFLSMTLSYLRPNYFDGKELRSALPTSVMLFLCGLFNSFVVDFIIRQRISIHATMSHVLELPIPRLKEGNPYFSEIVERVGSLICTTEEFKLLKKELNIRRVATDSEVREKLVAQINAYTAKIFEISKQELEYILSTFPLVEDRTKSMVMEEFGRTT